MDSSGKDQPRGQAQPDAVCANWDEEDQHGAPTVFCQDCADYLCQLCQEIHKRQKSLRSHKLLPVAELSTEAVEEFQARRQTPKCQKHDQDLMVYCDTCSVPVCPVCCVISHQNHSCRDLATVASELKAKLQEASTPLVTTLSKYDSLLEDLGQKEECIIDQFAHGSSQLSASLKKAMATLKAQESALQSKLRDHEAAVKARLSDAKTQIQTLKSTAEHLCSKIDNVCTMKMHQELELTKQAPTLLKEIHQLQGAVPKSVDFAAKVKYATQGGDVTASLAGLVTLHDDRDAATDAAQLPDLQQERTLTRSGSGYAPTSVTSTDDTLYVVIGGENRLYYCDVRRGSGNQTGQMLPFSATLSQGLQEAKLCAVGKNEVLLGWPGNPGPFAASGTTTSKSSTMYLLHWHDNQKTLSFEQSHLIEGHIKALSSHSAGNVIIATMNPSKIEVWEVSAKPILKGMQWEHISFLVMEQVVALPNFKTLKKAVESGCNFAVLTETDAPQARKAYTSSASSVERAQVRWVDCSGRTLHSYGDGSSHIPLDITPVSRQHLLVSEYSKHETSGKIVLLDASGQHLKTVIDVQRNIGKPVAIHWSKAREELYLPSNNNQQIFVYHVVGVTKNIAELEAGSKKCHSNIMLDILLPEFDKEKKASHDVAKPSVQTSTGHSVTSLSNRGVFTVGPTNAPAGFARTRGLQTPKRWVRGLHPGREELGPTLGGGGPGTYSPRENFENWCL